MRHPSLTPTRSLLPYPYPYPYPPPAQGSTIAWTPNAEKLASEVDRSP